MVRVRALLSVYLAGTYVPEGDECIDSILGQCFKTGWQGREAHGFEV